MRFYRTGKKFFYLDGEERKDTDSHYAIDFIDKEVVFYCFPIEGSKNFATLSFADLRNLIDNLKRQGVIE